MLAAMPALAYADILRVVPTDKEHTGMAIITEATSELTATVTANGKTVADVWLVLIVDQATYAGLNSITLSGTDGPTSIDTSDPWSAALTSGRLPEENDPHVVPIPYPGCTVPQTNYQVAAVISQMSQVHEDVISVRYILVYGFDWVDKQNNRVFTVTVESSTRVNMLVLGQGIEGETDVLNENTPFSGSTLMVPEVGTLLLGLGALAGFALFITLRRKSQKLPL